MSISQGKNIKVKQDLCVILKSSSYFSLPFSPPPNNPSLCCPGALEMEQREVVRYRRGAYCGQ